VQTVFPHTDDIGIVNRLLAEYCSRYFPSLQYLVLLGTDTYDDVHDEAPEHAKRFDRDNPIMLRGYVLPGDQEHPLTIWGIETVRDTTLFVCVPHLIAAGLATRDEATKEITIAAKAGDRFLYSKSILYDVLEWRRGPPFANTDIPLFFQATAEKVRPDSDIYDTLET